MSLQDNLPHILHECLMPVLGEVSAVESTDAVCHYILSLTSTKGLLPNSLFLQLAFLNLCGDIGCKMCLLDVMTIDLKILMNVF